MHKVLKGGVVFAAAMMFGAPFAAAQMDTSNMYLNREESGKMRIFGPDNMEGAEVLESENGAAPSNCPEGSYYARENSVYACGTNMQFDLMEPEQGAMMENGQPYPAGSRLLNMTEGQAIGNNNDTNEESGNPGDTESTGGNTGDTSDDSSGSGDGSGNGNGG